MTNTELRPDDGADENHPLERSAPSESAHSPHAIHATRNDAPHAPQLDQPAEPIFESEPLPPPGPGLLESVAWTIGYLALQVAGMVAVMVMIAVVTPLIVTADPAARRDPQAILDDIEFRAHMEQQMGGFNLAGAQLILLVGVLAAARLRVGKQTSKKLSIGTVRIGHFALIVLLVLPLAIISTAVSQGAQYYWSHLAAHFPFLHNFDSSNVLEAVPDIVKNNPLWLTILAIAVVPALAEELVFRGVIGRGLTARLGIVGGVVISSALFACAHIHPVHAAGVFCLGIAMHLTYLVTRSIVAPILLHFLNNLMAVIVTSFEGIPQTAQSALGESAISLPVAVAALACTLALMTLMWRTRVRYLLPDGSHWSPGYPTVEQPIATTNAVRYSGPAGGWLIATAVASYGLFWGALAWNESPMATSAHNSAPAAVAAVFLAQH